MHCPYKLYGVAFDGNGSIFFFGHIKIKLTCVVSSCVESSTTAVGLTVIYRETYIYTYILIAYTLFPIYLMVKRS